jgi:hypothetical protein
MQRPAKHEKYQQFDHDSYENTASQSPYPETVPLHAGDFAYKVAKLILDPVVLDQPHAHGVILVRLTCTGRP